MLRHVPHWVADREREAVAALVLRVGQTRAARVLGVDPTTVRRILRGETICRGTAALVRAQLVELAIGPVDIGAGRMRCER